MIEIVYEKEKQKPEGNEGFFRIPNNIRQIGEVNETQKIYIEDYAYTYLCRISSGNSSKGKAAILLGQANWKEGVSYLFVKSAVVLPDMEITEEHLSFTREIWNHVYEKNKEYFPDQEIVGWYLSIPGCSMELHEVICRTHLDHFGGNDKVLMVMEPLEKEEAFYRYDDGELSRQPGFYIYYEKNEPMQNFLVAQNDKAETKSEQVSDQAVKTFRKKVETKSEGKKQTKNIPVFRTASVCMMVAVLAVGVLYLNDYQKLKKTETVISKLDDKNSGKELVETKPVNGLVSENQKEEDQEGADKDAAGTDAENSGADTGAADPASGAEDNTSETRRIQMTRRTMRKFRVTMRQRKIQTAAVRMHQEQMQKQTASPTAKTARAVKTARTVQTVQTAGKRRMTVMTRIPAKLQVPHTSPIPFTRATL